MKATTVKKRQCVIHTLVLDNMVEAQKQFEIKLPKGIKKVSGVLVTASLLQQGG